MAPLRGPVNAAIEDAHHDRRVTLIERSEILSGSAAVSIARPEGRLVQVCLRCKSSLGRDRTGRSVREPRVWRIARLRGLGSGDLHSWRHTNGRP